MPMYVPLKERFLTSIRRSAKVLAVSLPVFSLVDAGFRRARFPVQQPDSFAPLTSFRFEKARTSWICEILVKVRPTVDIPLAFEAAFFQIL